MKEEFLTPEAVERLLVQQDVPREKAHATAYGLQKQYQKQQGVKRIDGVPTRAPRSGPKNDYNSRRSPRQLEHEIQCELIATVRAHEHKIPELKLLFAVPNGGKRSIKTAVKLKREGGKAGISDLFLPVARISPDATGLRGGFFGCWIEMKRPGGRMTDEQSQWLTDMRLQGYKTAVHHTALGAWEEILAYLAL